MTRSGNFYTEEELLSMRKEAEKRAREMNERSRGFIHTEEKREEKPVKIPEKPLPAGKIKDGDLTVLLLVLLLMREKADRKLILALIWILI